MSHEDDEPDAPYTFYIQRGGGPELWIQERAAVKFGRVEARGKGVWTQTVLTSDGTEHTIRIVTRGDQFLGQIKNYDVDVDSQSIPGGPHRNRESAIRTAQEYVAFSHRDWEDNGDIVE